MASASIPGRYRPSRGANARDAAQAAGIGPRAVQKRGLLALLPAILVLYSILLPHEVRFTLMEQTVYSYRAASLLVIPWLLYTIVRGRFEFRSIDLLVILGGSWMIISFVAVYGMGQGLASGTSIAIDALVPYLVGRHCIRSADDLRRLLVVFAPGVLLAGLSLTAEALSHRPLVHDMAARLFGRLSAAEYGYDVGTTTAVDFRLGLMRASGPFSHPIHAGVILASLVPLYFTSGLRGWPRLAGLGAGLMSFFTVSSGAVLALFFGVALLAYDQAQKIIQFINWRMLLVGSTALLSLVQLVAPNGIVPIVIRYTFNPATGYYRQLIWEYGSLSVVNNPLFGIGLEPFQRPAWMLDTIDHHWLALAMTHGLVSAVCLFLACVAAIILPALAARHAVETERRFLVGIAISLFCLLIVGFTVAYFRSAGVYLLFMIGAGISTGVAARSQNWSQEQSAAEPPIAKRA